MYNEEQEADDMCRKRCIIFLGCQKRQRLLSPEFPEDKIDFFDTLLDDLVTFILCKLSSFASCPSDFVNFLTSDIFLSCILLNIDFIGFVLLSETDSQRKYFIIGGGEVYVNMKNGILELFIL